jgi:hypothetical protein
MLMAAAVDIDPVVICRSERIGYARPLRMNPNVYERPLPSPLLNVG